MKRWLAPLGATVVMLAAGGMPPARALPADLPRTGTGLPVLQVRGCHRDAERHFVPEFGERLWHFHRGPDCRPRRVDAPGREDCHREVRRHYLPRYGRAMAHRHVGPECRVRVYRPYEGRPQRPDSCIRIGAVQFCEY